MEAPNKDTMLILQWWEKLEETQQEKWIHFFIDNIKPKHNPKFDNIQSTMPMKTSTIIFINEQMRLNQMKNFDNKCKKFLNDPEFDEKFGYLRTRKCSTNHHINRLL